MVIDLQRPFCKLRSLPRTSAKHCVLRLFEFVGMLIGLRKAAQTLQRSLSHLFRKLDYVRNYQGNILVPSNVQEQHQLHFEEPLSFLEAAKLQVQVLGQILNQPV